MDEVAGVAEAPRAATEPSDGFENWHCSVAMAMHLPAVGVQPSQTVQLGDSGT